MVRRITYSHQKPCLLCPHSFSGTSVLTFRFSCSGSVRTAFSYFYTSPAPLLRRCYPHSVCLSTLFRMAERCFRCCGRASSDVSYGLSRGVGKALWQYETGSSVLRKSLSGCGVGRGRICRSRHVAFLMA